jgi:hypothetical protein
MPEFDFMEFEVVLVSALKALMLKIRERITKNFIAIPFVRTFAWEIESPESYDGHGTAISHDRQ